MQAKLDAFKAQFISLANLMLEEIDLDTRDKICSKIHSAMPAQLSQQSAGKKRAKKSGTSPAPGKGSTKADVLNAMKSFVGFEKK